MKKAEITQKELNHLLEKYYSCNHCRKGDCELWGGKNTPFDVCECGAEDFMNAINEVCNIIEED